MNSQGSQGGQSPDNKSIPIKEQGHTITIDQASSSSWYEESDTTPTAKTDVRRLDSERKQLDHDNNQLQNRIKMMESEQ